MESSEKRQPTLYVSFILINRYHYIQFRKIILWWVPRGRFNQGYKLHVKENKYLGSQGRKHLSTFCSPFLNKDETYTSHRSRSLLRRITVFLQSSEHTENDTWTALTWCQGVKSLMKEEWLASEKHPYELPRLLGLTAHLHQLEALSLDIHPGFWHKTTVAPGLSGISSPWMDPSHCRLPRDCQATSPLDLWQNLPLDGPWLYPPLAFVCHPLHSVSAIVVSKYILFITLCYTMPAWHLSFLPFIQRRLHMDRVTPYKIMLFQILSTCKRSTVRIGTRRLLHARAHNFEQRLTAERALACMCKLERACAHACLHACLVVGPNGLF